MKTVESDADAAQSRIDSAELNKIVDTDAGEDVCDVTDSLCIEANKDRNRDLQKKVTELEKKGIMKPQDAENTQVSEEKPDKELVKKLAENEVKNKQEKKAIEQKKQQVAAQQKLTEQEKQKVEAEKKKVAEAKAKSEVELKKIAE